MTNPSGAASGAAPRPFLSFTTAVSLFLNGELAGEALSSLVIDYSCTLKINERLHGIKKVEESTDF
jgi:hypothetical protein